MSVKEMCRVRVSKSIQNKDGEVDPPRVSWRQKFSKKDYPLWGHDREDDGLVPEPVRRVESVLKVRDMVNLCRNEEGRWHYPTNGADVVFDKIFIGDSTTALCISILRELGISAVLNAAQGSLDEWNDVNTTEHYYKADGISFFGIRALDSKHFDIKEFFQQAADWIESQISSGRTVLVHCMVGISRSSTLVLAYLIIKKKMTLPDALNAVSRRRFIAPNRGFMQQLIDLDFSVHHKRKPSIN